MKEYLEDKYERPFPLYTLAHHLKQRFQIKSKGDAALELVDMLQRELPKRKGETEAYLEF